MTHAARAPHPPPRLAARCGTTPCDLPGAACRPFAAAERYRPHRRRRRPRADPVRCRVRRQHPGGGRSGAAPTPRPPPRTADRWRRPAIGPLAGPRPSATVRAERPCGRREYRRKVSSRICRPRPRVARTARTPARRRSGGSYRRTAPHCLAPSRARRRASPSGPGPQRPTAVAHLGAVRRRRRPLRRSRRTDAGAPPHPTPGRHAPSSPGASYAPRSCTPPAATGMTAPHAPGTRPRRLPPLTPTTEDP